MQLTGIFDRSSFGFVGDSNFSKVVEWWEMTFLPLRKGVMIETGVVVFEGGRNNGVIWLISLDEDISSV